MNKKACLNRASVEDRMNAVCSRLGLPFTVVWTPDPSMNNHGLVDPKNHVIHIFDLNENDAWATLTHEVLELKIRPLLSFYRNLVNVLIEFIEKQVYREKEKFLESLPETMAVLFSEMEKVHACRGETRAKV